MIARKRALVERRTAREACRWSDGDTTRLWGEELPVRVVEAPSSRAERVEAKDGQLTLFVAKRWLGDSDQAVAHRERLAQAWVHSQLAEALPALFARHEAVMGVHASDVRLRTMKSRWGSCNVKSGAITLNTRLVGYPRHCLEYVVVHELCHLLEPSHNARFHTLMDRYYPAWREARQDLRA
ncbi:MAG: M48 family metallopeptidase [Atopobiaceae bacterium]|nr:M48 family metallopeptidase [Atopobiaceae bacterium]